MVENYPQLSPEEEAFLQNLEVPFKQGKEEIWERLSERLDAAPPAPKTVRVVSMRWVRISVAAAISLLVLGGFFARFYTRTLECGRGQHLSQVLPDGSRVNLNAESRISWHPLWWAFQREVSFEGEGFFEVKKGSKFSVISPQGSTRVLGTSFNIYARKENYRVFCLTGAVSVTAPGSGKEMFLKPNMSATVSQTVQVMESQDPAAVLSWKEGKFHFDSQALTEVLEELGRQYDISLRFDQKITSEMTYAGSFDRPKSPEKALELVCKIFNLNFEKMNEKAYKIFPN